MRTSELIEIIEQYDTLTSAKKERLEFIERGLLQNTFLVRDKSDTSREDFDLLCHNQNIAITFLGLLGYTLTIDKSMGIARLSCEKDSQRTRTPLKGTLAYLLCVIWTMYRDRIAEGSLSRVIYTTTADILSELERYNLRNYIGGTSYKDAMKELKRYNLIDFDSSDPTPSDTIISMYTSLRFCMNDEDFSAFVNNIVTDKLSKKKLESDLETDVEEYEEEDYNE